MDSAVYPEQRRASVPRCSDNTLVFLCDFRPWPCPPPVTRPCDIGWIPEGDSVTIALPAQCSVHQLRLALCSQAQELNSNPEPLGLLDPEKYILLYARGDDWYEIYDDCQVVRTLDIPWSHHRAGHLMARIVVTPPPPTDPEDGGRWPDAPLAALIGHDLNSEATGRLGELMFTRRKLASLRREELKLRDAVLYSTEPWTTSAPLPRGLLPCLSRDLPVTCHHLGRNSFTVMVDLKVTPQLLLAVCTRVMAHQGSDRGPPESFVLKVFGREEFLSGDFPLVDFLWVRKCLKSNQELHVSVVPVRQLPRETVRPTDWPLVDGFTGQPSSHDDLRLEGKDLDDIFLVSLWDCNRKLRFKLIGFDVPELPAKVPPSVYVEASLVYGNKVLLSLASTTKAFNEEVLWNEWLEFEVLLSDLPRGAKLGLAVNTTCNDASPKDPKSSPSSSGKAPDFQQKGRTGTLYFVNLLLVDHRSTLSQGPHTLHMWSYSGQEDEAFSSQADRLSSATNPDIAASMAVSILLDRYGFPVVLPSGAASPGSGPGQPQNVAPVRDDPGRTPLPRPPPVDDASPPRAPTPPPKRLSYVYGPAGTLCGPSTSFDVTRAVQEPTESTVWSACPTGSDSFMSPCSTSSTASSHPTVRALQGCAAPLPGALGSDGTAGVLGSDGAAGALGPDGAAGALGPDGAQYKRVRKQSVHYTSNLPHFLRSVDWLKRGVVEEVHWLLGLWDPAELDLSVALELLSFDFIDEGVRELAVRRLESLSNDEVLRYLLQLVQTLKVEPYHDSLLARYLLRRALRSKRIGHFFFWYVRSEVSTCPYFRQRMALILEAYLLGCGQALLDDFSLQVQAAEALRQVALQVKELYPDKTDLPSSAASKVQELLENCSLPKEFVVPFDPRLKAGPILLSSCKVMASKKKPLWMEFSPMPSPLPTPPLGIIFKLGDDLRQDMLVLQTLAVMDSIWQERSLELNMVPYGCISTGHNMGMIEVIRDSATIAAVQGSQGGTRGAFKNDALFNWLKTRCPLQEVHYSAVETFVSSCAGYCVATYVLGIGDRHNDNIMITDQGNLFHIDFGHILGNRKCFLGVRRERVPFVLTPDFLYVMGRVKGRDSLYIQRFKDICTEAYLSLCSRSHLLVTLFSLMLLTGIPELSAAHDLRYLREALQQGHGEEEAREHFLQQIQVCEQLGWTVQANWWIHMVAGIK